MGARIRAETESLRQWATETGRFLTAEDFGEITETCDQIGGASEHHVFLMAIGDRVLKVTIPPNFGARGESLAYLDNAVWANELFGDDIRLEGIVETESGLAIVISQPFIVGRAPTEAEVIEWFESQGYRAQPGGRWVHEGTGAVVADAHTGNLVMSSEGLIPIDLQILDLGRVHDS